VGAVGAIRQVTERAAPVPLLTRWGLSADADLVFRFLTGYGRRGAPAIAGELGMPAARVASALDELHAAGVVHRRAPTAWQVVDPAEAFELVRSRCRPAPPARPSPHLADLVGTHSTPLRHLRTAGDARARIAELAGLERHEHLAMHREPMFSAEQLAVAEPLDVALLARGVRIRALLPPPADGDALAPSHPPPAGLQYRELPHPLIKLMVFDRRVALLPADPADPCGAAVELTDPAVVGAFVTVFDTHWAQAADPTRKKVVPVVLQPREKALVGLLAEGMTDAAAAQRLGVSARTVSTTMRTLMDRLGVENRFQLGLALGALRATPIPGGPPSSGDERSEP
jgi:DNA-binding CsgD family transcriptional regulator